MVVIPTYGLHHNPKYTYYPNPNRFDPDNFCPIKFSHGINFVSYRLVMDQDHLGDGDHQVHLGDGPRNCIAMRFGIMQAKLGLITLLKRFKFKLSPKTTVPLVFRSESLILGSKEGMLVFVEEIKYESIVEFCFIEPNF